jgi:hypothetical protein
VTAKVDDQQQQVCPDHDPFHDNEETPVVGQRLLAELVCELLLLHPNRPLHPEVTAAMAAYQTWCHGQKVMVESEAIDGINGFRATATKASWSMWQNGPVSDRCRKYDSERSRIAATKRVLGALWSLYSADRSIEYQDDLAHLQSALAVWDDGRSQPAPS